MITRSAIALAVVLAGCGGVSPPTPPAIAPTVAAGRAATMTERILPLLPAGAQVIVELDLARVRGNAVVGAIVQRALGELGGGDGHIGVLPGLPSAISGADAGSPLAAADAVVLAAYGVGTAQAATVTIIATHADVSGARRLTPELVALGPVEWLDQLATRAALDAETPLTIAAPLRALREHAVPAGATGASVRVTAQLSFDARVALARQTGLEMAPAQLSIWGDVADDLAIVIDADAADPGDKHAKTAAARMAKAVQGALGALADDPAVRALGLPSSLENARLATGGTWVRAVVTVGPSHLKRIVERATALLGPAAPGESAAPSAPTPSSTETAPPSGGAAGRGPAPAVVPALPPSGPS